MLAQMILKAVDLPDFLRMTLDQRKDMFSSRFTSSWVDNLHEFCNRSWTTSQVFEEVVLDDAIGDNEFQSEYLSS